MAASGTTTTLASTAPKLALASTEEQLLLLQQRAIIAKAAKEHQQMLLTLALETKALNAMLQETDKLAAQTAQATAPISDKSSYLPNISST